MPEISIVIPAKNEAPNIAGLLDEIDTACAPVCDYEVIVVDDGSDDGMDQILRERMKTHPNLRLLQHKNAAGQRASGGQSAGVHSGVRAAKGSIICTLDGDGQNPPSELPALMAPLRAANSEKIGLVAGQRVGRQDTMSKKLASKLANKIRGAILKDGTRDTGCGLKAFRREAFLALPYFDHMHRYLPALFSRDGWQVAHVDVAHRSRGGGSSNYNNLQRGLVGIVDLMGVAWLLRRRKKALPGEVMREE